MVSNREEGTAINYLRAVVYLLALSLIAAGCKKKPIETTPPLHRPAGKQLVVCKLACYI